jgi:LysM repeat protein
MRLRFRDVRRSEGCPQTCIYQCTMQAAFLVSATFTGGSPLGSPAGTTIKRILPFAAAPAALAGLAAAFTLGNSSGGISAVTDAAAHQQAAAAIPQAAAPKAADSGSPLVSITQQSATGVPVVRLDAGRLAAIEPKGKHHRTTPASYTVQSGDTLASIAQHLYHSADYWPVLYWANQAKIKYASEIQSGQVLKVPAKPGKIPGAPTAAAPAPAAPAPAPAASSTGSYSAAGSTAAAPVQTASAGGSGSFQACVIAAESGGNSQVMNASGHYGLYQFSASTWAAYGGNPADFGNASVAEQNRVFDNAIAAGGQSNWAPYDGC